MSAAFIPSRMQITTDRYKMMIAAGVLTKYDRVELIDGDLLNMAPIGSKHSAITSRFHELFVLKGVKLRLYARYGVAEYWVVDVEGRRIVTYREPSVQGYARTLECAGGDLVAPLAFPDVKIAVGDLFG